MKTKATKTIKYWKYQYETFNNPTLSENGNIGAGTSFAVLSKNQHRGYDPWKAFADGDDVIWHSDSGIPTWYIFYNPDPLKISKIQILNDPEVGCGNGDFQGSDNGINWTTICSFTGSATRGATWSFNPNNSTPYRYFRFWFTKSHYNDSWIVIKKITLTAKKAKIVSGTSSDNDFTTEEWVVKSFKVGDNYRMYNE